MHACSSPALNISSSDLLEVFTVRMIMVSMFITRHVLDILTIDFESASCITIVEERGRMGVPLGPEYLIDITSL